MKRILCIVFACLLLAACAKTPANEPAAPVSEVTDPTAAPVVSDPVPAIDPVSLPTFTVPEINGYADFSDVLAAKLIDGTQNRNLSPISVYLALAMVAEGANGNTQAELLKLLGCRDVTELRGVCGAMLNKLTANDEDATLTFANSLWMGDRDGALNFREPFLSALADTYRSEANAVKFGTVETSKQISDWIAEHTNGKITPSPDAMQFDPSTIAVLINTIYLKAAWRDPFYAAATKPGTFRAPDGDMTVDYMQQGFDNSYIVKGDGYLRYTLVTTVGSVTFVLPDEGVSLESLLGSPEKIHALFHDGKGINADVHVKLPKFKFFDKMELNKVLASLGLTLAFSETQADFSAMCDVPAYISRVLQESYIGVDEDGIEAAAYTMVAVAEGAAMEIEELPKIDFHLERPFLFEIKAFDGSVLFIGTVTAPTPAGE